MGARDLVEQLFREWYAYRIPIALTVAVLLMAAVVILVRSGGYRRMVRIVRAYPRASVLAVLVPLMVVLPVGYYLVSPLWQRINVDEPSPLAAVTVTPAGATPVASAVAAAAMSQPRVVLTGDFAGADEFHFGRGRAQLLETTPGMFTLRFEDFSVRNGPDLFVYLSDSPDGYSTSALKLGRLKATDGNFNYEVPAGVDTTRFRSAIVWCEAFSTLFATARFK